MKAADRKAAVVSEKEMVARFKCAGKYGWNVKVDHNAQRRLAERLIKEHGLKPVGIKVVAE